MAEISNESNYASKGISGTALGLGIAGTALALLNGGILGGNGILGMGNSGNISGTAAGIAAGAGMTELAQREVRDHDYSLIQQGQIQIDSLKEQMANRERDISEKIAIYKQSAADDNRINSSIADVKQYATDGLVDVYRENATQFRTLEKTVGENKLDAYKDIADLYRVGAVADKNLELQIERNREVDQREKFGLYKDLTSQTNKLAYDTMKQSYEDRIAGMNQLGALAARVSALEKNEAVTAAQLPLMFSLAESNSNFNLQKAVCKKIDGSLTLNPSQINNPVLPPTPPAPYPVFTTTGV